MDAYTSASGLAALADDTRRRIFELVAAGPMPVGEVAAQLPVSRPAVSQHLKVLREAGLVQEAREGTRRIYSVDPSGLASLRDYVDGLWTLALDRFQLAAEAEARTQPRTTPREDRR